MKKLFSLIMLTGLLASCNKLDKKVLSSDRKEILEALCKDLSSADCALLNTKVGLVVAASHTGKLGKKAALATWEKPVEEITFRDLLEKE